MANMQKYSRMQDIGHLCKHYERSVASGHYSNEEIDESKIKDDYNLAPERGKQTDYIKQKIDEICEGKTLRKDAVKMCTWVINYPSSLPPEGSQKFFEEAYNFLVDRYGSRSGLGEDVVISAYVHTSETTDHMHFAFLPVVQRTSGKAFCAKEVVGKKELQSFHEDFSIYMSERNICKKSDILNGNTKRDSRGRVLSVRELKKQTRERERAREQESRWNRNLDTEERKLDRW